MVVFRSTLTRKATFQYEPTEASTSPSSLAGTTSTTTLSSPSMSSLPSTSVLPTTHQNKHVATRPGDLSLALRFRSRASSAEDAPTYYRGDNITGDVVLTLSPEQAQHVTSVEVEASLYSATFSSRFHFQPCTLLKLACPLASR